MSETHDESLGSIILHHVTNDLSYKFIDLHVFGYDISITKHVIMLWIAAALTVSLAIYGTRRYRKNENSQPKGISHLYEILINFIRNDIVIPNIGEYHCQFWTPLIATYFIFILTCNFLGLIPLFDLVPGGSSTVTGNFNATAGLATITFFAIIIAGTMKHGFLGYWKNMIPGGVPAPVLLILIPIEILGMFVRPFALTMRLGANMTAGHIGMLAIFALPIILVSAPVGIASILLNTGIYFLEMIVSFVQAYVFTLLSSVFIGMAIHAEH
jgi:F-type H+-transporting ATPase subunit a